MKSFTVELKTMSAVRFIDNNIGNGLKYMIDNNQPQVQQLEDFIRDKVEANEMVDGIAWIESEQGRAKVETFSKQDAQLHELKVAYAAFQQHFRNQYNQDFVPRAPTQSASSNPQFDAKAFVATRFAKK